MKILHKGITNVHCNSSLFLHTIFQYFQVCNIALHITSRGGVLVERCDCGCVGHVPCEEKIGVLSFASCVVSEDILH